MKLVARFSLIILWSMLSACFSVDEKKIATIADISNEPMDSELSEGVSPVRTRAIEYYKAYLQKTEFKTHYAEALRRVADLELEISELNKALEQDDSAGLEIMGSSIEHYKTYLKTYPGHAANDLILYQLAKAYSMLGDIENSKLVLDEIVRDYPESRYMDEVQFRRAEIFFVDQDYGNAETSYRAVVEGYRDSTLYEKAVYKLGWSQFKLSKYDESIRTYIKLLDAKQRENKITALGIVVDIKKSEKEFIEDVLRVVSLSLSYQGGYQTVDSVLQGKQRRNYEPLIYKSLAELYIKKQRYRDAADVYMAYTRKYPLSELSPDFHENALQAYIDGGIKEKILDTKIEYVQKYGVATAFWNAHSVTVRSRLQPKLVTHITELAQHYHAIARSSKKAKDFNVAAQWYREFLSSFPLHEKSAYMNFLLAESLFDAGEYQQAVIEYEKTAYRYAPHDRSAEAGYAVLVTYNEIIDRAQSQKNTAVLTKLNNQLLNSSIQFSNAFPDDKNAPAVITKTAESLYAIKKYEMAIGFSSRIINSQKPVKKTHLKTCLIVNAHANFELASYAAAEKSYQAAISLLVSTSKADLDLRRQLTEKMAASVYKQAEQFKQQNNLQLAVYHFQRVADISPVSDIRATADFDAATILMKSNDWQTSIKVLEGFIKVFPGHKEYGFDVRTKLAYSYKQVGDFDKAAVEMLALSKLAVDKSEKSDLLWEAADSYEKANNKAMAVGVYKLYITDYPQNFERLMESHERVAQYYQQLGQVRNEIVWLSKLISAESKGANRRTGRTRYLAAKASYKLAQVEIKKFKDVAMLVPLKKSLKTKKKYMKSAVDSLKKVLAYKVADFTTAATYQLADIYSQLAISLMGSERPRGLSDDELELYDILLEEQAYPFEEKAIDIHASNIKRTRQGVYDEWIEKSIAELAKIQPVRFAKKETIEPYVLITQ